MLRVTKSFWKKEDIAIAPSILLFSDEKFVKCWCKQTAEGGGGLLRERSE